jgi:hypothetical protein
VPQTIPTDVTGLDKHQRPGVNCLAGGAAHLQGWHALLLSLGHLTPAEFEAQWREEHTLVLDSELRIA